MPRFTLRRTTAPLDRTTAPLDLMTWQRRHDPEDLEETPAELAYAAVHSVVCPDEFVRAPWISPGRTALATAVEAALAERASGTGLVDAIYADAHRALWPGEDVLPACASPARTQLRAACHEVHAGR